MPAIPTPAFDSGRSRQRERRLLKRSIAVIGNGGIWTIQLPSSTTAAFELVQMSSFSTPAIELIQKSAFPTAAFGLIYLGLFLPYFPLLLSAFFSLLRRLLLRLRSPVRLLRSCAELVLPGGRPPPRPQLR